jgi:tetratricopeptide (TPR) repeat protein
MFAEAVRRHGDGQVETAEALYRALLALEPDEPQVNYNLGLILHGRGALEGAMDAYRRAIALRPDFPDAHGNLGVALQASGRLPEAEAAYRGVLAMHPGFGMAMGNLGVTLKAMGRLDEAEAAYRRAIELMPDSSWAHTNLAAVLTDRGDNAGALAACEAAIALRPASDLALFNLGTIHKAESRLAEAAASFRAAIAVRPDFTEAHFSLGQVLLLDGAFEEGWAEYEWRWRLREYGWLRDLHGDFAQPLWAGEPLAGRVILIYAEQGMGDAIQYVRYVPRLVAVGASVVLAVHPPLRRLFAGMEGVRVIGLNERDLPPFDVHCPLLTLPRLFGTRLDTIPSAPRYLAAEPEAVARWRERLPTAGLRVGVIWAGNPTQTGDRFRSPRLPAVRALFDVPGIAFVALQLGDGRRDLQDAPLPPNVLDLGPEIADFTDTAAIMAGLDLVVTSCTAPLHLGGALGVPTWGMIPFAPHYPWLLEREDTPWYPSVRLVRQERPGADWSGVVARIARDLATLSGAAAAG